MTTETTLDYKALASDWMAAKHKENQWKERRLAIEAHLAKLFPNMKEEGQKTFSEGGFKTVAKNDIYIKVNDRETFLLGVQTGFVPSDLAQVELYETGFKRLRRLAMDQDEIALQTYARLQSLFTVTPAKMGFTVSKVA